MSGPLRPFIGMSIVSVIAAFLLVQIAKQFVELAGITRGLVFGGIWSAVTTLAGMRSFNRTARKLRSKVKRHSERR